MDAAAGPSLIAGRTAERARLLALVRSAVEGRPGAALLHGEAGVGKTSLVRSVVAEARRDGVQVLWGSGLRFDATDALLLPVSMALTRWLRESDPEDRAHVLEGVPEAGALLPSIGHGTTESAGVASRAVVIVEAVVDRILELGPVVFVVDDVQWADPASRDVLAYLIAGFSRQQLALVTTHRDEESGGSDNFRTWLADMRRMPSVSMMGIGRLDVEATRAQLTSLLGSRPPSILTEQVFARSQGNAYLTELLVSELDPASSTLPEQMPEALGAALLSAWNRLTPGARATTRFLAVGGRPAEVGTLREVVVDLTGDAALIVALHEAVDAGIVVVDKERAWFRHPLLADVLMDTFLPGEAASVHAAWARSLLRSQAVGIDEVRRQSALALHFEAAGDARGAFDASVRAAELAEQQQLTDEAARSLVRAAALWDRGAPAPDDTMALVALLERGGTLCNRSDRGAEAHALISRALNVVDQRAEPVLASRLLMGVMDLAWELGERDEQPAADAARAVDLASSAPDSPEYAEALVLLSANLRATFRGDEAAAVVEQAVGVARRSGSASALAMVFGARAATCADLNLADIDSQQGLTYALASGEDLSVGWAFVARANHLWRAGRVREMILLLREALDHAVTQGRGSRECSVLADNLLFVGDLLAAAEALRQGLSWSGKPNATIKLRLVGAVLASRQGNGQLATMHRARAYEVMPSLERRVGGASTAFLAEMMLAEADPESALSCLLDAKSAVRGDDLERLDEILVWGARAAADLVQTGADRRRPELVTRARKGLGDLIAFRGSLPGIPYLPRGNSDLVLPAMGALFHAERLRATGRGDLVAAWRAAATACKRADMRWDQHQALWRLGAELVGHHTARTEAAEVLRAAHRYATQQGATPLRNRIEEVAASGRITLTDPPVPPPRDVRPAAFAELTERESEILSYLLANRTNAQIASELVISAKTVSVHVSNILRKTSTTSRQEVAALAVRLAWETPRRAL